MKHVLHAAALCRLYLRRHKLFVAPGFRIWYYHSAHTQTHTRTHWNTLMTSLSQCCFITSVTSYCKHQANTGRQQHTRHYKIRLPMCTFIWSNSRTAFSWRKYFPFPCQNSVLQNTCAPFPFSPLCSRCPTMTYGLLVRLGVQCFSLALYVQHESKIKNVVNE